MDLLEMFSIFQNNPFYAAPIYEWRSIFGSFFDIIDPFTRLSGHFAKKIACIICGYFHDTHFCRNNLVRARSAIDPDCPDFYVKHDDINLVKWDLGKMIGAIVDLLGISPIGPRVLNNVLGRPSRKKNYVTIFPNTAFVGWKTLVPGHRVRVYCTAESDPERLATILDDLWLHDDSQSIMLSPTAQPYNDVVAKMFKLGGSVFLTLPELIGLNGLGKFTPKKTLAGALKKFQSGVIGQEISHSQNILDRSKNKNVFVKYADKWIISMENSPFPLMVKDIFGIKMKQIMVKHPEEEYWRWDLHCNANGEVFVPLESREETAIMAKKLSETARRGIKRGLEEINKACKAQAKNEDKLVRSKILNIHRHLDNSIFLQDHKAVYQPEREIEWITSLDELLN